MSDETFEAMLRSKGYGDLDASLALNVEARRARKAEDDLRAQLAAVTAERDALEAKADALQDSAYLAGLKAGWNFGIAEDRAGYAGAVAGRDGYLRALSSAQTKPLPSTQSAAKESHD